MPAQQTRSVIEQELGGVPLEEVFEWIELDEPLGSASIAQVKPAGLVLQHCRPYRVVQNNLIACAGIGATCGFVALSLWYAATGTVVWK